MAVTQLASAADVKAALGRDLTSDESARVGAILDKASELFRLRSGQQFTSGTSDVRLKSNGGIVRLVQRPVVSVESVTTDDGAPVAFELVGSSLHTNLRSHEFARVQYTHGGTVPDLVRLTVAEIAKKVLAVPADARSGLSQFSRTDGPFTDSGTYAAWAVGGQTMLSPDDAAIADSFRVRGGSVIVQSSR